MPGGEELDFQNAPDLAPDAADVTLAMFTSIVERPDP
jgi:hypothetical protein